MVMHTNGYDFRVNLEDPFSSFTWQIRFAAGARSILEIGCATGYISQSLTNQGSCVTGIEYDPGAAARARQVCARVVVGDIEDRAVRQQVTERFDVVLLGDV
jgi:2-polyprenyl-3-methyl-5-hydroxy-6-metoxy-1,4-benzoquinol methylase